jgi:hypothetical protein
MKRMSESIFEAVTGCPIATQNIDINLKNRQIAINKYGYGPANPNDIEADNKSFWQNKADMWKSSVENVQTMRCENCAAFNVSDKMRSCISKGFDEEGNDPMATIEKADIGYCAFLHFKCAGDRTCDAWIVGGAVDNKDLTENYKKLETIIREIKK